MPWFSQPTNIVWIHSCSSPLLIWASPWLDWKTLFVLHSYTFLSPQFDNDKSAFFVDNPDWKFILFQNLLVCIHCYSSPHFIKKNPWLDWKTLFLELPSVSFLSAKIDNDTSIFFRRLPWSKNISLSEPTRMHTLLMTLFVKLNTDTFLNAKFWHWHKQIFL